MRHPNNSRFTYHNVCINDSPSALLSNVFIIPVQNFRVNVFTDRAKHSQTAEIMVLRVMQVNLLEWTSKKYFAVGAAEGRPLGFFWARKSGHE